MVGEAVIILHVEDDPAHAEIARRNLQQFRVANKIYHVEDGQEALDYLFRQGKYTNPNDSPRPHIILLDLRLPKVDGLEVLETIKADESLASIPVVILTTSAAEKDVSSAYSRHISSYLVKPIDFPKFKELMDFFGYYWLAWNHYPKPE